MLPHRRSVRDFQLARDLKKGHSVRLESRARSVWKWKVIVGKACRETETAREREREEESALQSASSSPDRSSTQPLIDKQINPSRYEIIIEDDEIRQGCHSCGSSTPRRGNRADLRVAQGHKVPQAAEELPHTRHKCFGTKEKREKEGTEESKKTHGIVVHTQCKGSLTRTSAIGGLRIESPSVLSK
ncbi:uncharacterized protein BJX67DRAFT_46417 [Aspergillus lucknowensis]|uniref:Uncharacterized protein n=1 Tax=Aspergillus lucknowensis TaxID=176173 RepID=A0ABR4LVQ1_9EURO